MLREKWEGWEGVNQVGFFFSIQKERKKEKTQQLKAAQTIEQVTINLR